MTKCKRKITKEQYERAVANNGHLLGSDYKDVFDIGELCGYGVYLPLVKEEDGEYYVYFSLGSSCD